jgi:hypothetical protein
MFVYFLDCAALEALLPKTIRVDLVGGNTPASVSVWLPDERILTVPLTPRGSLY